MGTNKYQIINSDCISAMNKMDDNSIDLILTDPPYNLGKFMKDRATNLKQMRSNFFGAAGWDDLDFAEWEQSMDSFFEEASRVIRPGGSMIVFMAIIKVETIIKLATKHGFYYKTTGIWHKQNPMPRNMNLHFINSTESWIYFVYKKHTGTTAKQFMTFLKHLLLQQVNASTESIQRKSLWRFLSRWFSYLLTKETPFLIRLWEVVALELPLSKITGSSLALKLTQTTAQSAWRV